MELEAHELRVASELAFEILRETFHDLAAHCTFDGQVDPEALRILEARVDLALHRVVSSRTGTIRWEIGAHAAEMVRIVIRDTHGAIRRTHRGLLTDAP